MRLLLLQSGTAYSAFRKKQDFIFCYKETVKVDSSVGTMKSSGLCYNQLCLHFDNCQNMQTRLLFPHRGPLCFLCDKISFTERNSTRTRNNFAKFKIRVKNGKIQKKIDQ